MRITRFMEMSLAIAISVLATAPGRAQDSHIGNLIGRDKRGEVLYARYCVGCHGKLGDGAGENAPHVNPQYPQPRDFTSGLFKCRSTPSGSIPLDSDLFETVGRGINTTAMPSWFPLTRQERADLVAYIKTFSARFKEEEAEPPVPVPHEPSWAADSIARGKEQYETLKCAECHGLDGKGNGPSASSLRDSKSNPIPPYDFTTGSRFKCGQTDQDLVRILLTGMDGTPMPTYSDYLQDDQVWDLVHYLRTLQAKSKHRALWTGLFSD